MWIIKKNTFYFDPLSESSERKPAIPQNIRESAEKKLCIKIPHVVGKKEFPPEIILLYRRVMGHFVVPRFYPILNRLPYKYAESFQKSHPVNFPINIQLISKNQEVVFEKLREHFSRPNGCNLIMATGQGKTFLASALIGALQCRTLVVTHSQEISATWVSILGSGGGCVGEFNGKKKTAGDVVVGVINSLVKQPPSWFDFDFVIYDEVTEFTSERRREIFFLAAAPYLLGLTATPAGPKSEIFRQHLGEFIHAKNLPGYSETEINWRVNIRALKYFGPPEHTAPILSSIGYISACEMDKQFMADPYRNRLIIREIEALAKAKKNIYVFVSICAYGEIIKSLIPQELQSHVVDVLMGSQKSASVSDLRSKQDYSIILTTYKFCSKGISIDKMDAIILCQPRKADTEQTIGRILRASGDPSSKRIIVDIIDARTSLKNQFSVRKKIYAELGFNVEISKVEWEKIDSEDF